VNFNVVTDNDGGLLFKNLRDRKVNISTNAVGGAFAL